MLNTVEWDYFNLKDLFEEIKISKSLNKNQLDFSKDNKGINYITRSSLNNGFLGKVYSDTINLDTYIVEGNCLTVAMVGESFTSFYQKEKFVTSQNIAILKNKKLTKQEYFFLIPILEKEMYRYGYGRTLNITHLRNTKIKLPVNSSGLPNWDFMRDYIKNLSNNSLDNFYETKKNIKINLKDRNWDYFKLEDLFSIKRGKRHISANREKGDIPYVSASDKNNGVTDFISNPLFLENKGLVLTTFGDVYYHDNVFTASDEINILKNKNLNVYIGLFISTLLKKEEFRYSFGRKLYYNKIKTKVIKLPVDNEGNPDWQFMEDYIKSLPYTKHL